MKKIFLPIGWILDAIIWLFKPRVFLIKPQDLTENDKEFFTTLYADVKKVSIK